VHSQYGGIKLIEYPCNGVTVNWADAKSPAGVPVTFTLYPPPVTLATINAVAVNVPLEIEQVCDATTLLDIEQAVSLTEKPEPVTVTVAPPEPEFGLSDIVGTVTGSVVELAVIAI